MRLLVCSLESPRPPLNGLRLQLEQLTTHLARRHDVTVLAYRHPEQDGRAPEGVEMIEVPPPSRGACQRVRELVRAAREHEPVGSVALWPSMVAPLRGLLAGRRFDVAHVTGSNLARISPELRGTPAVLAALDAWHLNSHAVTVSQPAWARPLYRLEERWIRAFEAEAYRPYERVVFVSDADAAAARSLDPTIATEVIPNGVDADVYAPGERDERQAGLIVLTGAMHYPPNVEAACFLVEQVLPLVRARRPDARVAIVGRTPSAAVRDLAAPGVVEVTGEVADVVPWLRRASAYACLMRSGTGIKNKLLEAMAAGAPSVATPLALQGMDVEPGRHLLVGESAQECADAIVRLLEDPGLGRRMGEEARRRMVERHSWAAVADRYAAVYEAVRR